MAMSAAEPQVPLALTFKGLHKQQHHPRLPQESPALLQGGQGGAEVVDWLCDGPGVQKRFKDLIFTQTFI